MPPPPPGPLSGRRIAVLFRSGHTLEQAWSGTVSGVLTGLRELGADAYPVNAEPSGAGSLALRAWGRLRGGALNGAHAPEIVATRRLLARRRGDAAGPFDAVVQIGSDFGIPFGGRIVTLEDMTVAQALRLPGDYQRLGKGVRKRWRDDQARLYATASACLAASAWAASSIIEDYDVDPARVHVVGLGRNHELTGTARAWSPPRFLFVGREWERKRGPELLRALRRLREDIPEARLDVVGGHPPVDQDGVTGHGALGFVDPGERSRIGALFGSATCFVMPSQFEPFGLAYVEAATAGLPSIGTTSGGAGEAIGPGGVLVSPDDEAGLLGALRELSDPERARALGRAAQAHAELFTWRRVAERIARALALPDVATEDLSPFLEAPPRLPRPELA